MHVLSSATWKRNQSASIWCWLSGYWSKFRLWLRPLRILRFDSLLLETLTSLTCVKTSIWKVGASSESERPQKIGQNIRELLSQTSLANPDSFRRFDSESGFRETTHRLLLLHNKLHTSKEKDRGKDSHHHHVYWDKTSAILNQKQFRESLVRAWGSLNRRGSGGFIYFFWRFENLIAKRQKINDRVPPILVAYVIEMMS